MLIASILDWSPDDWNKVITSVGAVVASIGVVVTAVLQYLSKKKLSEVVVKTDEQTNILKKQDETLSTHGEQLDSIQKSEAKGEK